MGNTLVDLVRTSTLDRQHRPLLTVYDDTVGTRTELSYATADNWASKTANLLIEELDLRPGAVVALDVDGHWTAAVLTLACWKAGMAVTGQVAGRGADLVCCHAARLHAHPGGPVLVVGDGLRAEPLDPVAERDGMVLLGEDVHAYADDHDGADVRPATPAVLTATGALDHAALLEHARRWRRVIDDGARVGVVGALDDVQVQLLLAGVVAAGGSLCTVRPVPRASPWDRWTSERVTVAVGPHDAVADAPDGMDVVDLPGEGDA